MAESQERSLEKSGDLLSGSTIKLTENSMLESIVVHLVSLEEKVSDMVEILDSLVQSSSGKAMI